MVLDVLHKKTKHTIHVYRYVIKSNKFLITNKKLKIVLISNKIVKKIKKIKSQLTSLLIYKDKQKT